MSKGDHVFNNIVAKLNGAMDEAFITYAREKGVTGAVMNADIRISQGRGDREDWMRHHMPRTLSLLIAFREDVALKQVREGLQTAIYLGQDANNTVYSDHAQAFQNAVVALFSKVARVRSYMDEGELNPDIKRIRRAFFHMTHAAEDTGALDRLLAEYQGNAGEQARIRKSVDEVRESLEWAWGRCERIFRTAAGELLRLAR